jgi:hypothetical protein
MQHPATANYSAWPPLGRIPVEGSPRTVFRVVQGPEFPESHTRLFQRSRSV